MIIQNEMKVALNTTALECSSVLNGKNLRLLVTDSSQNLAIKLMSKVIG